MRNAYLSTLYDLTKKNRQVYSLVSDIGAIVFDKYREDFPENFINVGVAEANMLSIASGMASCGKIPFTYTIAPFITMRAYEQIRNDVCLQKQNVKIVGVGAGFVYSTLGPTHHASEDIAIMRVLPHMTVISPADPLETKKATLAAAEIDGPVYLRLGTSKEPDVYKEDYDFRVGEGVVLKDGGDVTIIATGVLVYDAYRAVEELEHKGIYAKLINMHTLKPLDEQIILSAAKDTPCIVTVEEHNTIGGLGSAVCEVIAKHSDRIVPVRCLGIEDTFCCKYGTHDQLKSAYGLNVSNIVLAVEKLVTRKREIGEVQVRAFHLMKI
jgi:transketolase